MSPLTIVTGPRGGGKNNFVYRMALCSPGPIYSNFLIRSQKFHRIDLIDLLKLYRSTKLTLCIDEPYAWMDSRQSMSYINVYMGFIAFQLRKTDMNIFVSLTQLSSLEKRYRDEWDYLVECKRLDNGSGDWRTWDFLYAILDSKRENIQEYIMPYVEASKWFGGYDTKEIIVPRNISRMEYEIYKQDPEQFFKRGLEISNSIKSYVRDLTRDGIELTLLNLGYDQVWGGLVYKILKKGFHPVKV